MASDFVTPLGRWSYQYLLEPSRGKDGSQEPTYSVKALLPKDGEGVAEFIAKLQEGIKRKVADKFGTRAPKGMYCALKDGDTWTYKNSQDLQKDDHPEMAGCWVIQCKSKNRPAVVSADPSVEIINPSDIKSGDYGKVGFDVYCWERPDGAGVSFGLNTAQFIKAGEPLGRAPAKPTDDFSTVIQDSQGSGQPQTTEAPIDSMFQ